MVTVTGGGRPHVVSVTFAVDGNYTYTAVDAKPKNEAARGGLQRVRNIGAHPWVALLADHYADHWTALWWVRADGSASVVTEPGLLARPIGMLTARYPQYRDVAARPRDRDPGRAVVRLGRGVVTPIWPVTSHGPDFPSSVGRWPISRG